MTRSCCAVLIVLVLIPALARRAFAAAPEYQKAPEAIRKVLDIPPPPTASLSPRRDYLVLAERQRYPGIAELFRPVLRLAGLRIDPQTNGPQQLSHFTGFTLQPIAGGKPVRLGDQGP